MRDKKGKEPGKLPLKKLLNFILAREVKVFMSGCHAVSNDFRKILA